MRDAGAGVENLGVAFEDVGGFSTKDVSVVLSTIRRKLLCWGYKTCMNVVSPSISP
jgi:hypothetical protein